MSLQEQLQQTVEEHNEIVDQLTLLQDERVKKLGAIEMLQKLVRAEQEAEVKDPEEDPAEEAEDEG